MSILYLTCGPTHSGKTTFGKKLREALGESAKIIHVDNDEVDEFIKAKFKNLRNDKEVLARRTPTDPDLRLLLPQTIANYALREGYSVIATAAHPRSVIRETYYEIARRNNAKIVLLLFNVDDTEIVRRIKQDGRDLGALDISPLGGATTFEELLEKQKGIFEMPTETEKASCFKVLEITHENADEALSAAQALFQEE